MSKDKQATEAINGVFGNLENESGKGSDPMDLIMDIPLTVTVELGRTSMLIDDLLKLTRGSLVELNKLAGEPMEILINKRLVARGEVVVVNEKFGVRLTDIISPMSKFEPAQ